MEDTRLLGMTTRLSAWPSAAASRQPNPICSRHVDLLVFVRMSSSMARTQVPASAKAAMCVPAQRGHRSSAVPD